MLHILLPLHSIFGSPWWCLGHAQWHDFISEIATVLIAFLPQTRWEQRSEKKQRNLHSVLLLQIVIQSQHQIIPQVLKW